MAHVGMHRCPQVLIVLREGSCMGGARGSARESLGERAIGALFLDGLVMFANCTMPPPSGGPNLSCDRAPLPRVPGRRATERLSVSLLTGE